MVDGSSYFGGVADHHPDPAYPCWLTLYAVRKSKLFGKTPLHIAAEKNYSDVARVLVERGAKVMILDGSGKTPLDLAGQEGHSKCIQLLLPYYDCNDKANIEQNKNNWSYNLMYYCFY